jgi:hypothetical protein
VQSYVDSIEFRFYPRHEFPLEAGGTEAWPAFEMELTLATVVNVMPPSVVEPIIEPDSDGLEPEHESEDLAGTGDNDVLGDDQ